MSDCDFEEIAIDSPIVKVHQDADSKKIANRNSRGGNTTKIPATTNHLGKPANIILTGGQTHDIVVALKLIEDLKPSMVLADTAYDSNKFRKQIKIK